MRTPTNFLLGETSLISVMEPKDKEKGDIEEFFKNILVLSLEVEAIFLTLNCLFPDCISTLKEALIRKIGNHQILIPQIVDWAKELISFVATTKVQKRVNLRSEPNGLLGLEKEIYE